MDANKKAILAGVAVITSAAVAYVMFGKKSAGNPGTQADTVPDSLLEEIVITAKKIGEGIASAATSAGDAIKGAVVQGQVATNTSLVNAYWQLPAAGEPYRAALEYASNQYAIPWPLLARVAYQESRFRADIISGKVRSSAGAVGIMQIVPKWHPELAQSGLTAEQAALDPDRAILYAAKYLRQLFRQFGTWEKALAAYNWGPGNLNNDLADGVLGNSWPAETKAYVSQIAKDVLLS